MALNRIQKNMIDQDFVKQVDDQAAQLAQNEKQLADVLNNGKVQIPSKFPELSFNVFRSSEGVFITDATPFNQFDWNDAEEIYISNTGDTHSNNGKNSIYPITINLFKENRTNGVYSGSKFILNLLDVIMGGDHILDIQDMDVLIRSQSVAGFTWISRLKRANVPTETSNWVLNDGVYETTQYNAHEIIDVVNINSLTESGGMPKPYTKVATLAECQTTAGTFYQNGSNAVIYCNPFKEHKIKQCMLLAITRRTQISTSSPNTIIFENVGFCAGSYAFNPNNLNARLYFFNCKFFRNRNDAFAITGKYQTYLINTVASYASKDCFNYHTDTKDSLAVEVNCIGYGAGMHKMAEGNTTQNSNNASTAHDGMTMMRFGGSYFDCEGPVIADVHNCPSLNIENNVGSVLETTTGVKAAYQFYNDGNVNRPEIANKYVVGSKIRKHNNELGIAGTPETHEIGVKGNREFTGGVASLDNYEEVI